MANINFKCDTPEISALRAIKHLALEIQEKEKVNFSIALGKASKELGYASYAAYRLDNMSASIASRHI